MTQLAAKASTHRAGLFELSRPEREEFVELVRIVMRTGDVSAESDADNQLGPIDPAFTAAMALVQTIQAQCVIAPASKGDSPPEES